jgi:ABC-type phosphate transport system substrate-binding protein
MLQQLLTLLAVLVVGFSTGWCGIPVQGQDSSTSAALSLEQRALHTIQIRANSVNLQLFQQVASAYMTNHAVKLKVVSGSQTAFLTGGYEMAATDRAVPPETNVQYPNVQAIPLVGNAIVPVYSLPSTVGNAQFVFPADSMCRIMLGNVTYWDDPTLVAANPSLLLPHMGITVHLPSGVTNIDVLTSYCSKINPYFATTIGWVTASPAWPTKKYYRYFAAASNAPMASNVVDNTGSFGVGTYQGLSSTGVKIGAILNPAGRLTSSSMTAISLTLLELALAPLDATSASRYQYDLTNAASPDAWPMVSIS